MTVTTPHASIMEDMKPDEVSLKTHKEHLYIYHWEAIGAGHKSVVLDKNGSIFKDILSLYKLWKTLIENSQ